MQVFCLQHEDFTDRTTGITFEPLAPEKRFTARKVSDQFGRERTLMAHSVAEVEDEEALEHFRGNPQMFFVPDDEDADAEDVADALENLQDKPFTVVERTDEDGDGTGWYDVEDPEGEVVSEKALRQEDAEKLAGHLNG